MLTIDIPSAYVICGAGAMFGAVMLRLACSSQPSVVGALRPSAAAALSLGLSLIALLVRAPAPGPAGQAAMNGGTPATIVVSTLWPTFVNDRLRAAITGASRSLVAGRWSCGLR